MTLFGLAALLAPVVGPTLGGWMTDQYTGLGLFDQRAYRSPGTWRMLRPLLRDPDYLIKERTELRRAAIHLTSIGLSLLVIVMVCWEVMLSKGQEWDWLGDPFWRVQTLAILFFAGLVGLIFWELRSPNPVVNFRPLAERNFSACCVIIFCVLCRALWRQHVSARLASIAVWLQRLGRGPRHVAGWILRCPCHAGRQPTARPKDGRTLAYWRGIAGDRRQQLLDVADEPRYQS